MNGKEATPLSDVYVECFVSALEGERLCEIRQESTCCLALHRVEWLATLQTTDSQRVLCHFRAPDAESVRMALRRLHIGFEALWVEHTG